MIPRIAFFICFVAAILLLAGCSGYGEDAGSAPAGSSAPPADSEFDHPPIAPVEADAGDPEALEKALEQNPGHTPILLRLAEIAMNNGDAAKAVEHLRAAIDAEPGNLDARLELGRALYETGDVEGAARETEAILEHAPANVDALYNLGAIYANQKQTDKAKEYWTRAVASGPGTPSAQSAQNGLDTLAGRGSMQRTIPDIPEHRGIAAAAGGPEAPAGPMDRNTRERLIHFAAEASKK